MGEIKEKEGQKKRFPADISLHKSHPSNVDSMSSPWSRGVISLGVMPNAGVGEAGHWRHK